MDVIFSPQNVTLNSVQYALDPVQYVENYYSSVEVENVFNCLTLKGNRLLLMEIIQN